MYASAVDNVMFIIIKADPSIQQENQSFSKCLYTYKHTISYDKDH
jgi:hypothetical protein